MRRMKEKVKGFNRGYAPRILAFHKKITEVAMQRS